jgi:hypothetical protein
MPCALEPDIWNGNLLTSFVGDVIQCWVSQMETLSGEGKFAETGQFPLANRASHATPRTKPLCPLGPGSWKDAVARHCDCSSIERGDKAPDDGEWRNTESRFVEQIILADEDRESGLKRN